MSKVYRIKPLEKKSISWEVEMYRQNADGTVSWFNVSDNYRWGQGFIEEDLDCNLPYEGDDKAYCKSDCGWGSELEDQHACWFEFSDDLDEEEKEEIEEFYLNGNPDDDGRAGAAWLFDGDHDWQVEDDYILVVGPFQVDFCEDDGTIIEENVKLKPRPDPNTSWPFSPEFPKPSDTE